MKPDYHLSDGELSLAWRESFYAPLAPSWIVISIWTCHRKGLICELGWTWLGLRYVKQ